jgi:hypothetical protein
MSERTRFIRHLPTLNSGWGRRRRAGMHRGEAVYGQDDLCLNLGDGEAATKLEKESVGG